MLNLVANAFLVVKTDPLVSTVGISSGDLLIPDRLPALVNLLADLVVAQKAWLARVLARRIRVQTCVRVLLCWRHVTVIGRRLQREAAAVRGQTKTELLRVCALHQPVLQNPLDAVRVI